MRQKIVFLLVLVALIVGAVIVMQWKGEKVDKMLARIGEGEFVLRVADDVAERARGLGGVQALAPDEGILFIFPNDDFHAIWMKDMLIPIDILWLSESGEVIDLRADVSPNSFPQIFAPHTPARFVVELSSGSTKMFGIKIGSRVQIFSE